MAGVAGRSGRKFNDLTGQRFGRLLAQRRIENIQNQAGWLCLCDCGNERRVPARDLRRGSATSCGCRKHESRGGITKPNGKVTPEYAAWSQAKARCSDAGHQAYHWYGARGVTMAPEWASSFTRFLADMGPRPGPGYSLDRIDNANGYEPGNCRWATWRVQQNNRRSNVRVEWRGRSLTISEWAAETGISYHALFLRLKNGWNIDDALTRPWKPRASRLRKAC